MDYEDTVFFIEGLGYGHASRTLPILKKMNGTVISSSNGAEYLKEAGIDIIEVDLSYDIYFNKEGADLIKNISRNIKWKNIKGIRKAKEVIDKSSVVFVDSSVSGLALSIMARKPTIYFANMTKISSFFSGIPSKALHGLMLQFLEKTKRRVVCDFPPPYTISADNLLMNELKHEFVGPTVDVSDIPRGKRSYVLVSGGGRNEISISEHLKKLEIPVAMKNPTFQEAIKVDNQRKALGKAEVCITHGGHSTIMECILLGVPIVCIPKRNYIERYNNSRMVERLGLGVCLDERFVDSMVLEKAIEDAIELRDNIRRFSAWAGKFKGVESTINIIKEVLKNES